MQQRTSTSQPSEIPEDIICPITSHIMTDPVILVESGNTYEREAILKWLKQKKTDPLTNEAISDDMIAPNRTVKRMIVSFLDKQIATNPHISHQTYLPESLIQRLIAAMEKNEINLFKETLQKDSRLLFNELKENKNIFMLACELASLEILEMIITQLDARIRQLTCIETDNGRSSLIMVSRRLGLKGAACIAKAIDWKLSQFQDFLVFCVQENDTRMANIALSLGAVATPELLNQAYAQKKTGIVKVLILFGASIQNEDQQGNDFLMRTIEDSNIPLTLFLLSQCTDQLNLNKMNEAKDSALTLAIQKGQSDVVKALLNHPQVNINHTNRQKDTALHLATRNQDQEMVKLLIENKISLNEKNGQGRTALDMAYQPYPKNDFSLLKLLILSGAQVEDLLLKAIENNQVELIEFLLTDAKQLVNPHISDSKGQTTLLLAIQKNQLKTVSLLLGQPGMNMNQVDAYGNTALHHAAMLGRNDIIKLLMKQHASIKDKNKEKKTPVQLARENDYTDLANWMEEKHQYKKVKPFLKPLQAKQKSAQQQIALLQQENIALKSSLEKLSIFSEKYAQSLMTIVEREKQHKKAIERERQRKREDIERGRGNPLQNPLVEALLKADLESVKMLEAGGASLLYPNMDGLYPLVAAVYGCSLETVRYVELKLKDEAEKQWAQVDANKALENLNHWMMPTDLSPNATHGELGNWYVKHNGASWCAVYDSECLKKEGFPNWGGKVSWTEVACPIWSRADDLWGADGSRVRAHKNYLGASLHRTPEAWTTRNFLHQAHVPDTVSPLGMVRGGRGRGRGYRQINDPNWGGAVGLLSPSRKIHDDVVKTIREQLNELRNDVETKAKRSSNAVFKF